MPAIVSSIASVSVPVTTRKASTREAAEAAWAKTDLEDFGASAGFGKMGAETDTLEDVMAGFGVDHLNDEYPLSEYGTITEGTDAITNTKDWLKSIAEETVEKYEEDPDVHENVTPEMVQEAFDLMAAAIDEEFAGKFERIVSVDHLIQEDGDTEMHVLAGQKKDGTWLTFCYSDFPF